MLFEQVVEEKVVRSRKRAKVERAYW
jgi:hypothetical protein